MESFHLANKAIEEPRRTAGESGFDVWSNYFFCPTLCRRCKFFSKVDSNWPYHCKAKTNQAASHKSRRENFRQYDECREYSEIEKKEDAEKEARRSLENAANEAAARKREAEEAALREAQFELIRQEAQRIADNEEQVQRIADNKQNYFISCIANGEIEEVRAILRTGDFSATLPDKKGISPVMAALMAEKFEIADILIGLDGSIPDLNSIVVSLIRNRSFRAIDYLSRKKKLDLNHIGTMFDILTLTDETSSLLQLKQCFSENNLLNQFLISRSRQICLAYRSADVNKIKCFELLCDSREDFQSILCNAENLIKQQENDKKLEAINNERNRIRDAVLSEIERIAEFGVYSSPDITDENWANFSSSFPLLNRSEIVAIVDSTIRNNMTTGLAIASDGIYWVNSKSILSGKQKLDQKNLRHSVSWKEINERKIEFKKRWLVLEIVDGYFFDLSGSDLIFRKKLLIDVLNNINTLVNQLKNLNAINHD